MKRYDFVVDFAEFFKEIKPSLDGENIKYSYRIHSDDSILIKLW